MKKVDKDIQNLMDDMIETMYHAPGIGLAAIQIGVPKRVVVMDLSKNPDRKKPMYFINPEIIWKSNVNSSYEEGCLSIPNQFAKVERPDKCHIKYLDYEGNEKKLEAEGLLSTCIQHEIDHLNGQIQTARRIYRGLCNNDPVTNVVSSTIQNSTGVFKQI